MATGPGIKDQVHFWNTYERQDLWGTAKDTSPQKLAENVSEFSLQPTVHERNMATGLLCQTQDEIAVDTERSIAKLTTKTPLTPTYAKDLLPALFQKKGTGWTATGNVWTIYPLDYGNLPVPKANIANQDGHFFTLVTRDPESGKCHQAKNAFAVSHKLSLHKVDNDGLLYLETEWNGQGYAEAVTVAGTPVAPSFTYLYKASELAVMTIGGVSVVAPLVGFEVEATCNGKYQLDMPTGEWKAGKTEIKGNIVLFEGSETHTLRTYTLSKAAGAATEVIFYWGNSATPDAAGELACTLNVYFDDGATRNMTEFGPQITLPFRGVYGADTAVNHAAKFVFYAA